MPDPNPTAAAPAADADATLLAALQEIRRRGAIGERNLVDAIAHARRFVACLPPSGPRRSRLVDLGSGGGLPGLVIAHDRPDCEVFLVERRGARADQLRRACRALGIDAQVVERDVAEVSADPAFRGLADVVTARSFGTAKVVATFAAALLRSGGTLLVSEPPGAADRWRDLHGSTWVDRSTLDAGIRRLQRR